jgi:hypothetical protein
MDLGQTDLRDLMKLCYAIRFRFYAPDQIDHMSLNGSVDRLSNTGGQLMCHEKMHHQMPCCQRLLVLQGSVWPQHFIL